MSKKIGYKSLCIFLVLHFVCLLLAGCGAEADERGQGSADEGGNSVGPNGRKVLTSRRKPAGVTKICRHGSRWTFCQVRDRIW